MIHAGRSRRWMTSATFARLARLGLESPEPALLAFGAIIGVCRVTGCVPVAEAGDDAWAVGPWCIQLADVQPLAKPIRCRGWLKIFDVALTPAQQAQVTAALSRRQVRGSVE